MVSTVLSTTDSEIQTVVDVVVTASIPTLVSILVLVLVSVVGEEEESLHINPFSRTNCAAGNNSVLGTD